MFFGWKIAIDIVCNDDSILQRTAMSSLLVLLLESKQSFLLLLLPPTTSMISQSSLAGKLTNETNSQCQIPNL